MAPIEDEILAAQFSARRAEAEAYLRREMEKLGLFERDGWSIGEVTRERGGGSELVLKPIHRTLPSPEGVECVVRIREDEPSVDSHCEGPDAS